MVFSFRRQKSTNKSRSIVTIRIPTFLLKRYHALDMWCVHVYLTINSKFNVNATSSSANTLYLRHWTTLHSLENLIFEPFRSKIKFVFTKVSKKYPPRLWTHLFQQPTLLTVSPWIDYKLPWIFLRAFRLSVRLQAKTEGQPLLAKFRLICTTPTQLVHLIMTWLQNKTIQQCLTIF